MLKLQCNLEEENLKLHKEESQQLRVQCKTYETKIEDLTRQLDIQVKVKNPGSLEKVKH
jgi:hypothetical protein